MFVILCFAGHYAHAQDLEYGEGLEEEIRLFTLQELDAVLDFSFQYEDEEEKRPRVSEETDAITDRTLEERRTQFEERLILKSKGSFYHPNLLEFSLNTTLGLRQEKQRGDFRKRDDEFLDEYDITLDFLKQKPFNLSLFASSFSSTVDREFFDTIEVDTDFLGALFRYQNKLFPMSLFLQTRDTEEDAADFKRDRTEKTAEFKISNEREDTLSSNFIYTYKKVTEKIPFTQEETRHNLLLSNIIDYKKMRGSSNISYFKTTGIIDTSLIQIVENLQLEHSKTLTTLYNYNFSHSENEGFNSDVNWGNLGFRHKLYKSLETEVKAEFSHTDAADFKEFYYGPRISLAYRKKVPGGIFAANYNLFYHRTDRKIEGDEEDGSIRRIFGEQLKLSDGQRAMLKNPNVIISSVIVRDTDGIILLQDQDYKLIVRGRTLEIRRVDLPNNFLIIVDYETKSLPRLKYETISSGFSLTYDFRDFCSLYFNNTEVVHNEGSALRALRDQDEGITLSLQDTKKTIYGAELRWRWFNILGEYEDDRSDFIPFEAWRVRGNFKISLTDFISFTLNGNHTKTDFDTEKGTITFDSVNATLNLRFNNLLEGEFGAGYLTEEGQDIDDRIWKVRADLKSQFRSVELRLETDYSDRDEISEDRKDFSVRFRLIRYFSIL